MPIRQRLGRAVEIGVCRVLHIRREGIAAVHKPPVLGPVAGYAQDHALLADGDSQLAHDIAVRAHSGGSPARIGTVVHRKTVVMFGHRHHEFCAGLRKQLGPGCRVKLFGLEQRDEIFVAKLVLGAPAHPVIHIGRVGWPVHIAGIPFVAKGRHAVRPPVDEDPEFAVLVPGRGLVSFERIPIGLKGTGCSYLANLLNRRFYPGLSLGVQNSVPSTIIKASLYGPAFLIPLQSRVPLARARGRRSRSRLPNR